MSYGNSDCFSNSDMIANCNGDIKHKELNSNHNENEKFLPHDNHKRKDPRNGMIKKRKEKKEKQIAMNNTMDVVVHVHETDGCSRRWTNREKYLLCLCSLLFFACVAFVVVAFIRDSNHGKFFIIFFTYTYIYMYIFRRMCNLLIVYAINSHNDLVPS